MQIDPCLSPCTKSNSKWIKDLNIRPDALNLREKKVGNYLKLIGMGKDFLNMTSLAQALRLKLSKQDCMKLKSYVTKDIIIRAKC